jgi:hypothetical protein
MAVPEMSCVLRRAGHPVGGRKITIVTAYGDRGERKTRW